MKRGWHLSLLTVVSHLGGLVNSHTPDLSVVLHLVHQFKVRRPPEWTMYQLFNMEQTCRGSLPRPQQRDCRLWKEVSEQWQAQWDRPPLLLPYLHQPRLPLDPGDHDLHQHHHRRHHRRRHRRCDHHRLNSLLDTGRRSTAQSSKPPAFDLPWNQVKLILLEK